MNRAFAVIISVHPVQKWMPRQRYDSKFSGGIRSERYVWDHCELERRDIGYAAGDHTGDTLVSLFKRTVRVTGGWMKTFADRIAERASGTWRYINYTEGYARKDSETTRGDWHHII